MTPSGSRLSTRDVVARAIYTEVREGRGTPHGGVFLDVSHLPDDTVKTRLPSMYDQFLELAGVDITREPMEVGPTCHYMMGGVSVDGETGASRVPGLFATGECTGGMNGANRLGGNSLSDLLVFGKRAGEGAADHAAGAPEPAIEDAAIADAEAELVDYLEGPAGEDPYELHAELQATMQADFGIFRDAETLGGGAGGDRRAGAPRGDRPCVLARARLQRRLAAVPRSAQHADRVRGGRPRRAAAPREPRRPLTARLSRFR